MADDDQLLRELYNQNRRGGDEEPPEFDRIFQRARDASQNRALRRRRIAIAALAATVLVIFGIGFFSFSDGPETPQPAPIAETVEPTSQDDPEEKPEPAGDEIALDDEEQWQELLEFADEIWQWDSPTDFLL